MFTTIISSAALSSSVDPSWVIVDCRFDLKNDAWGYQQYLLAHVPGAVYAGLNKDLSGIVTGRNGRHPLPSIDEMAATFGRLGIGHHTQVVAYDQDVGIFASRLWWMLRYLGHQAVAVLDGGWATWTREQRPTRSGVEDRSSVIFTPAPRPEAAVDATTVAAKLTDDDTLLIDARSPDRFRGENESLDRVAGHIPGATNHFYKWNVSDEGTMLPASTLREQFQSLLGTHVPEQTVMYCGSGVTACHNLLAMTHAGLEGAALYPGSWSEWSSDPARPVETGSSAATRDEQ